jgi:hypothetical protein
LQARTRPRSNQEIDERDLHQSCCSIEKETRKNLNPHNIAKFPLLRGILFISLSLKRAEIQDDPRVSHLEEAAVRSEWEENEKSGFNQSSPVPLC